MKRFAWIALVLACGPQSGGVDGSEGGADTTGSVSTTSGDPTGDPTGDPSSTTVPGTTTSTATSVTTTDIDTSSDDAATDDCGAPAPDAGGGEPASCDIWAEDCPCGQKCMPWANDGGNTWNATRCVGISSDPKQVGEPCTVEGNGVSGIDDCDIHSMCWDVDPDTLMGECVAFCTGSEADPMCEEPGAFCAQSSDNPMSLCLPTCHPLADDCPANEVCVATNEEFFCAVDASGDAGAAGDPCEYVNACDPGLHCASAEYVPDCAAIGCCAPFCDLLVADPCPGSAPDVECLPWFEEGQAPPGYETLGLCGVPP